MGDMFWWDILAHFWIFSGFFEVYSNASASNGANVSIAVFSGIWYSPDLCWIGSYYSYLIIFFILAFFREILFR